MAKVRITKEFRFEASHALLNYDGLCKNIHGHSYILFVTVIGEPNIEESSPKLGMLMDFGDLKRIVKQEIVDVLDHSIILNSKAPYQSFTNVKDMFDRFHLFDYQPTCENMVVDFAQKIIKKLPEGVKIYSVKLYETATSNAEWYASDNI